MTLPATDTFTTGANGFLEDYSASWTSNSGAQTMALLAASDDVYARGGGGTLSLYHWNADTFNNDQYSQVKITAVASAGAVGPAARINTGTTKTGYYYLMDWNLATYVEKVVSGTITTLTTGDGATVNDVLRIECEGTTIRPKKNGSLDTSHGESTDSAIARGRAGFVWY